MDLSLADIALCGFDRAGCLAAAAACARASRRYGLATDSVAHLWLAGAHALAGDDEAMHAAVEQALAPRPDDPRILGDLYGRVLPTRSFVADDLGALRGQLDAMMPHVDAAPAGTSVFPGRLWWATLHTIDDDDHGAGPRAHFRRGRRGLGMAVFVAAADVADAVALGRAGEPGAAAALMASARERLRRMPRMAGMVHCQQLLVARAAARDGWGEPAAWLRESEAFFAAGGYHRLARRCRTMLGEVGRAGAAPRPGDVGGAGGAAWPRRHQPGGGRAHAGRRGPLDQGDRRAAVPVHQDRRAAPEQPGRPDRAARPGGAGASSPGSTASKWVTRRPLNSGVAPLPPRAAAAPR